MKPNYWLKTDIDRIEKDLLAMENAENKPNFIIVCGLPCSGKSTASEEIVKETPNTIVYSLESIRSEIFGDCGNTSADGELQMELYRRAALTLSYGRNVVIDAGNLSRKDRMAALKCTADIECMKRCLLIATPLEKCIEFNENREEGKTDPEIIEKARTNFDTPCTFEGFDKITVINEYKGFYGNYKDVVDKYIALRIKNEALTLGQHLGITGLLVSGDEDSSEALIRAAYLHDIGKIDRTDENSITKSGHEKAGSYDSFFYALSDKEEEESEELLLQTSTLISLHMVPQTFKKKDDTAEKCKAIWGDELYNSLVLLDKANAKAK